LPDFFSTYKMHIPTFSIVRPSKMYPNLDFWFENLPSGNPGGLVQYIVLLLIH
jgi:hypothetical protein